MTVDRIIIDATGTSTNMRYAVGSQHLLLDLQLIDWHVEDYEQLSEVSEATEVSRLEYCSSWAGGGSPRIRGVTADSDCL